MASTGNIMASSSNTGIETIFIYIHSKSKNFHLYFLEYNNIIVPLTLREAVSYVENYTEQTKSHCFLSFSLFDGQKVLQVLKFPMYRTASLRVSCTMK